MAEAGGRLSTQKSALIGGGGVEARAHFTKYSQWEDVEENPYKSYEYSRSKKLCSRLGQKHQKVVCFQAHWFRKKAKKYSPR